MGLDMYLHKKQYVKNWEYNKDKIFKVIVKLNGNKHPTINPKNVVYVEEEVMYWRKANAIHRWFVENVQKGVDECQTSYLESSDLQKLLDDCLEVIKDIQIVNGVISNTKVAKEKLPTRSGFFFGGIEYDEYYLNDIKQTIKVLEKELSINYGDNIVEYYYRASW